MKWKFRKIIVRLLRLNNTPHEIAFGVALGVFIAILPLYGFHTLMVIIAMALIRRVNKIAILVGTNISLPPTVPFITWAGYEIGRYILKGRFDPLRWSDFKNVTFEKIASHYQPLFLGSLILGVISALVFYFLTFSVVKKIKERRENARRKYP